MFTEIPSGYMLVGFYKDQLFALRFNYSAGKKISVYRKTKIISNIWELFCDTRLNNLSKLSRLCVFGFPVACGIVDYNLWILAKGKVNLFL